MLFTMYLKWHNMETLWCAKDPLDKEKRWIVYKTDGVFRYKGVWIKNATETFVSEENSLEKCMWKCLSRSVEHIVNAAFNQDSLFNLDSIEFLSILNRMVQNGISTSGTMDNSLQL